VLDRGGLSGPADTMVAGDEDSVLAELTRFADAGLTDLIVSPYGTAPERRRVLGVIARWRT
jgi:5,10-methylenetetrahydromethanopterin reductase